MIIESMLVVIANQQVHFKVYSGSVHRGGEVRLATAIAQQCKYGKLDMRKLFSLAVSAEFGSSENLLVQGSKGAFMYDAPYMNPLPRVTPFMNEDRFIDPLMGPEGAMNGVTQVEVPVEAIIQPEPDFHVPAAQKGSFHTWAQGKADYLVQVFPVDEQMVIAAEEGAIYISRQQALGFFGADQLCREQCVELIERVARLQHRPLQLGNAEEDSFQLMALIKEARRILGMHTAELTRSLGEVFVAMTKNSATVEERRVLKDVVLFRLACGECGDDIPVMMHAFGCDYDLACDAVFSGQFDKAIAMLA